VSLKVVIAEDDLATAEYLKKIIEEVPDVEVVSIAGNGKEAIRQVEIYQPDVVFLDIDQTQHKEVILIKSDKHKLVIHPEEILFIESCGHKILIKTERGEHLVPGRLGELERRLDPRVFFRCHKGYLVNIEKIREIVPSGQSYNIVLHSGDRVFLSREREKVLLKKFIVE